MSMGLRAGERKGVLAEAIRSFSPWVARGEIISPPGGAVRFEPKHTHDKIAVRFVLRVASREACGPFAFGKSLPRKEGVPPIAQSGRLLHHTRIPGKAVRTVEPGSGAELLDRAVVFSCAASYGETAGRGRWE